MALWVQNREKLGADDLGLGPQPTPSLPSQGAPTRQAELFLRVRPVEFCQGPGQSCTNWGQVTGKGDREIPQRPPGGGLHGCHPGHPQGVRQSLSERYAILDSGIHALPAGRAVHMRRITAQQGFENLHRAGIDYAGTRRVSPGRLAVNDQGTNSAPLQLSRRRKAGGAGSHE